MADIDLKVTMTVTNGHVVERLANAVREFIDLYENNGWETDEGKELKAAIAEFVNNMDICRCQKPEVIKRALDHPR